MCHIINEREYKKKNGNLSIWDLNEESLLHQLGYNVSDSGLTADQRQVILSSIVESKIKSASDICAFLRWLIKLNNNRTKMQSAVQKWSEDYKYINEYKIGSRPIVGVKSIKGRNL